MSLKDVWIIMYAMNYGCKELKCPLICLCHILFDTAIFFSLSSWFHWGNTAKQSVLILILSYNMLYLWVEGFSTENKWSFWEVFCRGEWLSDNPFLVGGYFMVVKRLFRWRLIYNVNIRVRCWSVFLCHMFRLSHFLNKHFLVFQLQNVTFVCKQNCGIIGIKTLIYVL